jgi:hypothetical protein
MNKLMQRVLVTGLLLAACGVTARADEGDVTPDARLTVGYATQGGAKAPAVPTPQSGVAVWLTLIVLGAVCMGPLFLNAKRTHLD